MIDREERPLVEWLQEPAGQGPREGLMTALASTRAIAQRPALLAGDHWPSMGPSFARGTRPIIAFGLILAALLIATLALVAAGALRPKVLPPFGPAGNGELAWSNGGRIYVASPSDASMTGLQLVDGPAQTPTFSPDGTRLAFWRQEQTAGPLRLWVVDADGSNAHDVSGAMDITFTPLFSVSWSADSRTILFSSTDGGVDRLYTVPADGSRAPIAITQRDASRAWGSFSPDGQWIAFQKLVPGSKPTENVSIIRPDGTGEMDLYTHRLPGSDGGTIDGPAWSPDSKEVAYARLADPYEESGLNGRAILATAAIDREQSDQILYVHGNSDWISWPAYSPDGQWISFGTDDTETTGSVWLIHPWQMDRKPTLLFRSGKQGGANCWAPFSPDAKSLVAACGPWVLVPLDNPKGAQPLPIPEGATQLDWQRDVLP